MEKREIYESPEKKVTQTPEKIIDTFDDLKLSENTDRIETFDDISRRENQISIETFDDFKNKEEGESNIDISEKINSEVKDNPELTELERMEEAAASIKNIEWMQPEDWKSLGTDDDGIRKKRVALEHVGKALRDVYHTPDPPLITKKMAETNLLGEYGDPNIVIGSDYGINMNEIGFDPEKEKKLFGNDPRVALDTYGHEFRHSYQCEQAIAYEGGFEHLTDDPNKAREWFENLKDIKQPPEDKMKNTDPERYRKEFEAYENQPIERDAREFGEKLSNYVYEQNKEFSNK